MQAVSQAHKILMKYYLFNTGVKLTSGHWLKSPHDIADLSLFVVNQRRPANIGTIPSPCLLLLTTCRIFV